MALKATIFKADLSISDMPLNYMPRSLSARHPSENNKHMTVHAETHTVFAHSNVDFSYISKKR